jgi:hypothetical protein
MKRRLPRPRGAGRKIPPLPPAHLHDSENKIVREAVATINQVCHITGLNPYLVLRDWAGMLAPALERSGENARSMVLTGHFVEDTPAEAAHFKKARERYLRAADRYPSAYRAMQDAFAEVSAMLAVAAEPGLALYGRQSDLNPDIIGQIFVCLLEPGPVWRQYFPPWRVALAAAAAHLPDPAAVNDVVIETIVDAGRRLARARPGGVRLTPGENWSAYFAAVEPYLEPILLGPEVINSSVQMLALATRFPPWAVQSGVVRFVWDGADPLLAQMARINSCLYGLNGYTLELARMMQDTIAAQRDRQPDGRGEGVPDEIPEGVSLDPARPDSRVEPTFQYMFQNQGGDTP